MTQGREQMLVREFFGGARSGFFVEVGANRPQQESQTWHLEQLGWNGVLIEPQPKLAIDLCNARSAKVFAVACSSPQNAGRRMQLTAELQGRIWSRFVSREELPRHEAAGNVISTRRLAGKTLIHVHADARPDPSFEPVAPDLADVYFRAIKKRPAAAPQPEQAARAAV